MAEITKNKKSKPLETGIISDLGNTGNYDSEYTADYFRCRMDGWDEFKIFAEGCRKCKLNYS